MTVADKASAVAALLALARQTSGAPERHAELTRAVRALLVSGQGRRLSRALGALNGAPDAFAALHACINAAASRPSIPSGPQVAVFALPVCVFTGAPRRLRLPLLSRPAMERLLEAAGVAGAGATIRLLDGLLPQARLACATPQARWRLTEAVLRGELRPPARVALRRGGSPQMFYLVGVAAGPTAPPRFYQQDDAALADMAEACGRLLQADFEQAGGRGLVHAYPPDLLHAAVHSGGRELRLITLETELAARLLRRPRPADQHVAVVSEHAGRTLWLGVHDARARQMVLALNWPVESAEPVDEARADLVWLARACGVGRVIVLPGVQYGFDGAAPRLPSLDDLERVPPQAH